MTSAERVGEEISLGCSQDYLGEEKTELDHACCRWMSEIVTVDVAPEVRDFL